eukprot:2761495-Alexandrium_andersonii.AAC.1
MQSAGFRNPSGPVLYRARLKFDVAAMLSHRKRAMENGPFARCMLRYASPQKRQSTDVFLTEE